MTREEWLNAFTDHARPHFEKAGAPLPTVVRCSIGFPSGRVLGKVIGECWSDSTTSDSVHEIFLHPTLNNDERIADVLTHELVHAAVGLDAKHGPKFRKVAVALGLEGKMTATVAGDVWREWALPIIADLGPMARGDFKPARSSRGAPQKNRHLLLVCSDCGWQCRTTKAHIKPFMRCVDEDCGGELGEKP